MKILALGLIALASCVGTPTQGGAGPSPDATEAATLLHVEDGDTVTVLIGGSEVIVRLLGINAPERGECLHDEARRALEDLLSTGALSLEEHGIDQFGRTLAYVWVDEASVNLELVGSGMAIATTPSQGEELGPDLLSAEEEAYAVGEGLWDGCDREPAGSHELVIDTDGHDPPGPDDETIEQETVTIANQGAGAVDLTGWMLRDESSANRLRFAPDDLLHPGAHLTVSSADPGWDPGGTPVWNNGGDMAMLLDPDGGVVARHRYEDG